MKKYKYVMVNNLTYLKTDEDGNDDGKIYEYNGDHSSFCDGILPDDLQEIKQTKERLKVNLKTHKWIKAPFNKGYVLVSKEYLKQFKK